MPVEKFSARLFPNPSVNGISRLEIVLPKSQEVKVNLYDTKGALVLKLYEGAVKAFSIPVNLNGLADEFYIIKIWSEGEEQSFKIINK